MKPIYIEMKAFGSYRDEKIDFTGKSQGLFLITVCKTRRKDRSKILL